MKCSIVKICSIVGASGDRMHGVRAAVNGNASHIAEQVQGAQSTEQITLGQLTFKAERSGKTQTSSGTVPEIPLS